jgi:hypothetical protein
MWILKREVYNYLVYIPYFLNKKTITQSGKGKETESKEERGRRHEPERGRRLESVLGRNERTC